MTTPSSPKFLRRSLIVGVFFSLLLTGIGVKAYYLQVHKGPWLSKKAAGQYASSLKKTGKRGTIYDARYRPLAQTVEATSIGAHPAQIADKNQIAKKLAKIFNISHRTLEQLLSAQKPFVWIKRQASPKEVSAVRELAVSGITFVPEQTRFYPQRGLAAQAIGFTGVDGQGLEGVEFYYNSELKGDHDEFTYLRDAYGRRFDGDLPQADPASGRNLVLTLDATIQFFTEKALEQAVSDHEAQSGMAVVLDPKTGAIQALAQVPKFNPNSYRKFRKEHWRNRAITDPFEPGSTLKVFSIAAALETGNCSPNTIFYCENGAYRIGRNVVHDTKPHGWLSLQQIVKFSSNIGAVKVGEKMGAKTLHKYLKAFGFGERSGIDSPGESPGSLSPYKRWTRIDAGTIAFGQGVAVSAVQLAAAAGAVANDGILMKPYLVQAITDANGRLIRKNSPVQIRRVISADTARTLRQILGTVTSEGGTGTKAALKGYPVGGKTGTAQKIDETGAYSRNKFISSFVGFVPTDNPQAVILVVVDEPRKSHYGGTVAAPAFREIAQELINYRNLPTRDNSGQQTHLVGKGNAA
ncbi:MAG: penicillin-binding protein 2 [Desulfobacterales bacterium]